MNPLSGKKWKDRALLAVALLLMTAPSCASGQPGPAESPSNIGCLEHLEIPNYPPLARSARLHATLTVKALLSGQGTVQEIESSLQGKATGVEFFKPSVEKAIKNSRFSKTCGGKIITLVFYYELSSDEGSWAFEPPNHFFIRSGAVYVNPEVSGK